MLTVTNQNASNLQDHCDTEDKCSASIGPGFGVLQTGPSFPCARPGQEDSPGAELMGQ